MSERCCVFQPFDQGPYDKRYEDVIAPAIKAADGLEAYRVDKDPGATIPIETLHEEVRAAAACLADISSNNPNVWYELGFATASDKPLVIIRSKATSEPPPFDIRHRRIILYSAESPRDFTELQAEITSALKAELSNVRVMNVLASTAPPVAEKAEGLRAHEVALLALIMAASTYSDTEEIPYRLTPNSLKQDMEAASFTELATALALTSLMKQGYIKEKNFERDTMDEPVPFYVLTELGREWLLANQDRLAGQAPAKGSRCSGCGNINPVR